MAEALNFQPDPPICRRDVSIGCIGAGFIMAVVALAEIMGCDAKEIHLPIPAVMPLTKNDWPRR